MLSPADKAMKTLSLIEGGYIKQAGAQLADDFILEGFTPSPLSKEGFLELHQQLFDAFPDWSYNMSGIREKGQSVSMMVRITGTNTNDLTLTSYAIHEHATAKSIALPAQDVEFQFNEGLITRMTMGAGPEGNILVLLRQTGLLLPQEATV
jgi:hypothetical protein